MMEFIPLIYGISNYLFDHILGKGNNKAFSEFLIAIGFIYKLLPLSLLNRLFFKTRP